MDKGANKTIQIYRGHRKEVGYFFFTSGDALASLPRKSEDETPVVPAIRCEVFTDTWHFEGPCPSYRCDPLHLQSGQMGYSQHNRQQLNKQHTWGGSPPIPDCQSGFGAFLKHH